jgi:methanogenic corrinoid protein MtbC1
MEALMEEARARNRAMGVTGMLVHENGRFLQWLEGPSDSVEALWRSIQKDERHGEIEVLGEGVSPVRLFSEWDMRFLSRGAGASSDEAPSAADAEAFESARTALAECALRSDAEGLSDVVGELLVNGYDVKTLCAHLFEPTARQLGDWWCEDVCNSFEVTVALSHLQNAVRRLNATAAEGRDLGEVGRNILLSPQPKEPHMLGMTLLSGFFRRAGWTVQADFPKTDKELLSMVGSHWFDALGLTLSDVFTRRDRLTAMAATVRAVRAASKNPSLIVIVGGRAFRGGADGEVANVGADVHYASASEAVEKLDYWLFMRRFRDTEAEAALSKAGSLFTPFDLLKKLPPLLRRVQ